MTPNNQSPYNSHIYGREWEVSVLFRYFCTATDYDPAWGGRLIIPPPYRSQKFSLHMTLNVSLKVIHPHQPHRLNTWILPSGQSITFCRTDVRWLQFTDHTHTIKQWRHYTNTAHQDSSVFTTWRGFNRQTIHQRVLSGDYSSRITPTA